MAHIDPFLPAHDALRAALFTTTLLLGHADFRRPEDSAAAVAMTVALLVRVREYSTREDAAALPAFGARPELHASLISDHYRLSGLARDLERLLPRFERSDTAERVALGIRLRRRVARMTAEHLLHMERIETEAVRVLRAHLDDSTLAAMRSQLSGAPSAEPA